MTAVGAGAAGSMPKPCPEHGAPDDPAHRYCEVCGRELERVPLGEATGSSGWAAPATGSFAPAESPRSAGPTPTGRIEASGSVEVPESTELLRLADLSGPTALSRLEALAGPTGSSRPSGSSSTGSSSPTGPSAPSGLPAAAGCDGALAPAPPTAPDWRADPGGQPATTSWSGASGVAAVPPASRGAATPSGAPGWGAPTPFGVQSQPGERGGFVPQAAHPGAAGRAAPAQPDAPVGPENQAGYPPPPGPPGWSGPPVPPAPPGRTAVPAPPVPSGWTGARAPSAPSGWPGVPAPPAPSGWTGAPAPSAPSGWTGPAAPAGSSAWTGAAPSPGPAAGLPAAPADPGSPPGSWLSSRAVGQPCPGCGTPPSGDSGHCDHCGRRSSVGRDRADLDLGAVAAVTDRARRRRNEDAVTVGRLGQTIAAVVCDGVSTSLRADLAAHAAAEVALATMLSALGNGAAAPDAVLASGRAAATAARATALHDDGQVPPSCTFVAAVVTGGSVTVGWIGDSRAYWLGPDGAVQEAVCLTVDDSVVGQIRAGRPVPPGAEQDPTSKALIRWLGADSSDAEPQVVTFQPGRPGRLVICSDGLSHYLPNAAALAARVPGPGGATPIAIAQDLTRFAAEAGGHDNIAVAVLPFPPAAVSGGAGG
ncbi:protein phosphatase 2C domain-containing protein [Plantactinospora sp. KLBMP9567]|uniref:protein phosphatase 2C domain-containing protein n=1 Tax=Plantactinospora sp. KLBMP9567 TaxID=3085900 RepID=UPI002982531B|nr:protein phosphatase 2C domain-containing protein [Plantactinospora sp. KLBMP9567]MDW5330217.1 protein phosphatase 2C domain-containing protein [Plantactinospora sp. KLBMP9567]